MSSLKGARVFATGATGYIGSHLTKKLVEDGSEVHVLIRPSSSKKTIENLLAHHQIHVYDGSYQSMDQAIKKARPDIVFHLSSFASIRYETKDVPNMLESNVVMASYLLEAMAKNQVNKLVNTSSFSQHMNQALYHPNSLYAATKQAFEDILFYYTDGTAMNAITLVLFDNYGPHDPRPKLMNLIYRAASEGTTLLLSPGEQLLDLLYIDDVIAAYIVAAERLLANESSGMERFSVGSEKRISLRKLVSTVETVIGKQVRVKWGAIDYRPNEIMIPWHKGIRMPGWQQTITLERGIQMYFKENDAR
ncbi:NAD-dependent epimerase/dehydratase family protein [Halalkalibacter akibai]|uniref:CDP-abequose synthase n=1 Tax=Halalkalibacter akibai (strain ATCC 43226 / DSM 21942 / CIP 109018 / JCM 9157 / 1139) TaxID=1236973 RepID=W4QMG4_HALA3|nr:NAD(P)-dependent oxidoreductase [Halalkalibacter akibai]GAE33087.1 CDP-abequose synthase [Halalkalibacter akibai JCM 9157]